MVCVFFVATKLLMSAIWLLSINTEYWDCYFNNIYLATGANLRKSMNKPGLSDLLPAFGESNPSILLVQSMKRKSSGQSAFKQKHSQ